MPYAWLVHKAYRLFLFLSCTKFCLIEASSAGCLGIPEHICFLLPLTARQMFKDIGRQRATVPPTFTEIFHVMIASSELALNRWT